MFCPGFDRFDHCPKWFWELFLNTVQALVGGRTVFCRSPVVFLWLLHRLRSQVLRSSGRANRVRRVGAQVSRCFSEPHVATILDDEIHQNCIIWFETQLLAAIA